MTDENELEGQSRRTFLKTTGAVGVAATTGVAAFGGQAAAQQQTVDAVVDASGLSTDDTDQQTGQTELSGLINVNVQNVDIDALNNVIVQLGGVNVNVSDIEILNENEVQLVVNDVLNIIGNQVAVTLLGETVQGQQFEASGTDTIDLNQ